MLHILLVEDNPADVMLVREAIRRSSVQADVLIAYDGEQALRILDELQFAPDFILLDLNVPKFDGLTLLERHRDRFGAPVIVLTGSENPEDKRRALELGVHDYVVKPVGFDPFLSRVQELIERFTKQKAADQSAG